MPFGWFRHDSQAVLKDLGRVVRPFMATTMDPGPLGRVGGLASIETECWTHPLSRRNDQALYRPVHRVDDDHAFPAA